MQNGDFNNNVGLSPKPYKGPNLQYKYYTKAELEERFKIINGPQFQDLEKEQRYRKWYFDFLHTCGNSLKLPVWVIGSAIVFCQRFFIVRSIKKNDRVIICAACLLLACKVEDCNRSIIYIISVCYETRYKENNVELVKKLHNSKFMLKIRELVANAERSILYATNFAFETHAYPFILDILKQYFSGDKEFGQISLNVYNDSFQTNACLQVQPRVIAVASIVLATDILHKNLADYGFNDVKIWDKYQVSELQLRDIQIQIINSYEEKGNVNDKGAVKQVKERYRHLLEQKQEIKQIKNQSPSTQILNKIGNNLNYGSYLNGNGIKRPKPPPPPLPLSQDTPRKKQNIQLTEATQIKN